MGQAIYEVICVSGGFDPLHTGHLEMFHQAASHGALTVILNSDEWLLRKKGFVFLPWEHRAAIIGEMRYVANVVQVDDRDNSVCEALSRIKPRFFANGGDRKMTNTPEAALCESLGIGMLWNIGGEKADSSSDIARKCWVARKWGRYVTLDEGKGYKVKKVVINPGSSISLQYHRHRSEYWYIAGNHAQVQLDGNVFMVEKDKPLVAVNLGAVHQVTNMGDEELVMIEIQSGQRLEEDDIIRIEQQADVV